MIPLNHGVHIIPRHGKADLLEKNRVVGLCRSLIPFQHIAAARIIIGERVGQGIIGFLIATHQPSQIPSASHCVRAGIKAGGVVKVFNMFKIGPLLRGRFLKLHQTEFPSLAVNGGVESAFPPHHRFDQGRIQVVASCRVLNGEILTVFQPVAPPEPKAYCGEQQAGRDEPEVKYGFWFFDRPTKYTSFQRWERAVLCSGAWARNFLATTSKPLI
jgi:hypothetical protein